MMVTAAAAIGLPLAMVTGLAHVSPAGANGVPLAPGNVLAATGSGQVKQFTPSGTLVDTLDTTTGSTYTAGMCVDSSKNLYVTTFGSNTLSKFDSNGNLLAANWGSGFNADPESCTVDASNNIYVGQADGSHQILKFDTSGTLLASYSPAIDARGTDWIDLSSDQCTMYYTGEGTLIKRFNVCTNTQLPDFASGLPGPCFEIRIQTNGNVIVACGQGAVRLDSSGNVLQNYPIPGASEMFAMNLDPDGTSFWTGDIGNGTVTHVDIATGTILSQWNSSPSSALGGLLIVGGIVVAQPTLTLSPPTATRTVGTTHTVTATITNPGGSIAGQPVSFSVAGANSASGSGTTNASGQATFTYTGTNPGSDTVTGTFTGTSAVGTALVTWVTSGGSCTMAVGRGSTGPGDRGTVVNNVSTTLSAAQQFEFTWDNHLHHVNLVALTSAKCGANDRTGGPGLTFQGKGTAKLDGVGGYTLQFAISSNSTGNWVVAVQIKMGSTVVNTIADALPVSTEVIS